ncbi:MAG: PD-(D/E)XK nuclease family protein [Gammaproteobacteria bacterium]|nr:PD-(D/E)XK nuclease family protein [Gammaproteobacteria bacterium]
MSAPDSILLLPTSASFAREVAERLVLSHTAQLPDLSELTLVIAHAAMLKPLRAALAEAAGGALLLPRIVTARQFAAEAMPDSAAQPLPELECTLRLAEALSRFRSIFPGQDPLRVAEALYAIFDELVLNAATLPDDEAALAERLREAYGAQLIEPLSREAQIVHRLWRAYIEDIGERAPAFAYLAGLGAALNNRPHDAPLYWLGFDALTQAEAVLLRPQIEQGRLQFWTQGRAAGRDGAATRALLAALGQRPAAAAMVQASPRQALLDEAFADDTRTARDRAAAIPPDAARGLRIVAAAHAEHEARIVDLAVREAILAGARRVAIVSPDRRLARRVRALLERAGLTLEDRVGWALSTSRAAAALACWLECLATGFHFRPLLDLLKCGFFRIDDDDPDPGAEAALAGLLERALLRARSDDAPPVAGLAALQGLVDGRYPAAFERLHKAAAELPLAEAGRPRGDWAACLRESLKRLGLAAAFADDDAGSQVFAVLNALDAAIEASAIRLRWPEFRALLDRRLEQATFRPSNLAQPQVALYTLEQTPGLQADCLILASATRAQLPGSAPGEAFFNQSVRRELGLPTWQQRQALSLARLRRVLDAAPQVVITHAGSDGEPPQLSPWLDALEAFVHAAGQPSLHDPALAKRALLAAVDVADADAQRQPALPMLIACAEADAELIDWKLSAGGHQALIDCPYRWHASRLLRLKAETAPDQDPSRADYGQRVHRILQAFHAEIDPALPAPYRGGLGEDDREAIAAKLVALADAVFAADLAARPLAQVWRQDFAQLTPFLVAQLSAAGGGHIEVETDPQSQVAGWTLHGRLDRLQRRPGHNTVVDYKTGAVPKRDDVLAGESVQLPHYALEAGDVQQVAYWDLKKQATVEIDGEELADLATDIEARLLTMRAQLKEGALLIAHGDERSCARCEYSGICRHDSAIRR